MRTVFVALFLTVLGLGSVFAINNVYIYPGVLIRPDNNVTIVTGNYFNWSVLNVYSSYADLGHVKIYPSCSSGLVNMTLYGLSNSSASFAVHPALPVSIGFDWSRSYPSVTNISGRLIGNQSLPSFDRSSKILRAFLNASHSTGVYVDIYCPSGFSPTAVYVEGSSIMHVSGRSDLHSFPRGWYKSGSSMRLKFSAACPDEIVIPFSSVEEAPSNVTNSPWIPPVVFPSSARFPVWLFLLLLVSVAVIVSLVIYWEYD